MLGVVVFLLVLAPSIAIASPVDDCVSHVMPEDSRLEKPAFKGVELYSWKADGGFRFSLLWGTDRNKTEQEIKAASCVLVGVPEMKSALARLAAGSLEQPIVETSNALD